MRPTNNLDAVTCARRHHRPSTATSKPAKPTKHTHTLTHTQYQLYLFYIYSLQWCGALVAEEKNQMHHGDDNKNKQKKRPTKSDTKPRQGVTIEWLLSSHRSRTTRTRCVLSTCIDFNAECVFDNFFFCLWFRPLLPPQRHHNFALTTMSATTQRRAHTNLCRLTYIIIYCRASWGETNVFNSHYSTDQRLPSPVCLCLDGWLAGWLWVCVCLCRTRHPNTAAAAVHQWLKLTSWKEQRWIFFSKKFCEFPLHWRGGRQETAQFFAYK